MHRAKGEIPNKVVTRLCYVSRRLMKGDLSCKRHRVKERDWDLTSALRPPDE